MLLTLDLFQFAYSITGVTGADGKDGCLLEHHEHAPLVSSNASCRAFQSHGFTIGAATDPVVEPKTSARYGQLKSI